RSVTEIAATRDLSLAPNTSGLVLYLPLEEGTGQVLTDTTGGDTATLFMGVVGNGEGSVETPPPPASSPTSASSSPTTSPPATTFTTVVTSTSSTVTTTSTSSTTSSTAPTSSVGLVAAFGFEEASGTQAVDASGSGNNGVLSGATRTASGRFGSALVFNGTS